MKEKSIIILALLAVVALSAGCGDPPTMVGEVCQTDDHCGGSEQDLSLTCDHSVPGGSCTVTECELDNPDTLDVAEDLETCPEGSRCVREFIRTAPKCDKDTETRLVCRRSCTQQGDCGEVILCDPSCKEVDGEEVCSTECKNRIMCVPFWSHMPDPEDYQDPEDEAAAEAAAEEPPRACIVYGEGCVYHDPEE